jgi:hypothetical protein
MRVTVNRAAAPNIEWTPLASFCCNWTPLAYILGMPVVPLIVVETREFMRQAEEVWTEAERQEFVDHIARNPEAGDVIPETSGVCKVRWRRQGAVKRAGVRVIYFYHNLETPLFLLMVYSKAGREDVAPEAKKALSEFAARIKRVARG